jgi:hypothetical protein
MSNNDILIFVPFHDNFVNINKLFSLLPTGQRQLCTCPVCEMNAWAKPDAHLICGDRNEELEAEEPE